MAMIFNIDKVKQDTGFEDNTIYELTTIFINSFDTRLFEFNIASQQSDLQKIKKLAHALRGTAENCGAERISDVCLQLEKCEEFKFVLSERLKLLELELRDYQQHINFLIKT